MAGRFFTIGATRKAMIDKCVFIFIFYFVCVCLFLKLHFWPRDWENIEWLLPSKILQSSKGYRKQWTENSKNGILIPIQSMRLAINCSEPGGREANLSAAMAWKPVGEYGWFWNLQEDLSVPHFNHLPIYLFLLYGSWNKPCLFSAEWCHGDEPGVQEVEIPAVCPGVPYDSGARASTELPRLWGPSLGVVGGG